MHVNKCTCAMILYEAKARDERGFHFVPHQKAAAVLGRLLHGGNVVSQLRSYADVVHSLCTYTLCVDRLFSCLQYVKGYGKYLSPDWIQSHCLHGTYQIQKCDTGGTGSDYNVGTLDNTSLRIQLSQFFNMLFINISS